MSDLVVVCIPSVDGIARDPCGVVMGAAHQPVVVDRPHITDAQAASLGAWVGPVDWAIMGQYFAVALSLILSIWFTAYCVGAVLRAVKSI